MNTVAQLEKQQDDLKAFVRHSEMAQRLMGNRDFKALILDDYLIKEAARLVQLSDDPIVSLPERADALNMAKATGHLKRYLNVTIMMGDRAAIDIRDIDDTLVEARAEEHQAAIDGDDGGLI
jgi:hypothetical protein